MKLIDKRFWIFELMILLYDVATTCIEVVNYGISLLQ